MKNRYKGLITGMGQGSSFSEVNEENKFISLVNPEKKHEILGIIGEKTAFSEVNEEDAISYNETKLDDFNGVGNTQNSLKQELDSIGIESLAMLDEISAALPEKLQTYMMTNISLSQEIANGVKLLDNIKPGMSSKAIVGFANILPQGDFRMSVANNYSHSLQDKLQNTLKQLVKISKARDLLFEKNLIDEKDYTNFLKIKDSINSDLLRLEELSIQISETDDIFLKQEFNYKRDLLSNSILPIESTILDTINERYTNIERLKKLEIILKTAPIVLNSIIKKESNKLVNGLIDREIQAWSNTLLGIMQDDTEISSILSNTSNENVESKILALLSSRLENMNREVLASNEKINERQKEITSGIKRIDLAIGAFEKRTGVILGEKVA